MTTNKNNSFEKEEVRFVAAVENETDGTPLSVKRFIDAVFGDYFKNIPDGEYKKKLLLDIYKKRSSEKNKRTPAPVSVTDEEIEFLRKLDSDIKRRLFYSFIIRRKVHPHKSGWTSLDFENTILYGFDKKTAKKITLKDCAMCVEDGFTTRVSGSNKPTLCFQIPEFGGEVVWEFDDVEALQFYEHIWTDRNDDGRNASEYFIDEIS